MELPPPEIVAARARAALAYANIKLTEKGAPVKVGSITQATMARIISPTSPRGANSIEELWEIAEACGIPRSFMEEGFSAPASGDGRVGDLEMQMAAVGRAVELMAAELEGRFASQIEQRVAEVLKPIQSKPQPKGR